MLRKFENENKNQNKKNLRHKIYGKIRNGRLKLEPSFLIKKTCTHIISSSAIVKEAEIVKEAAIVKEAGKNDTSSKI